MNGVNGEEESCNAGTTFGQPVTGKSVEGQAANSVHNDIAQMKTEGTQSIQFVVKTISKGRDWPIAFVGVLQADVLSPKIIRKGAVPRSLPSNIFIGNLQVNLNW
jgi:hypothetical protein